MVSCFKVITFPLAIKMLVKTLNLEFFVDNLNKYPANYISTIKFGFLDPKNAGNDVSHMFLSLL